MGTSGGSLPSPSKAEELLSGAALPGSPQGMSCPGPQSARTDSMSRTYSGEPATSSKSLSSSGNTSYTSYDQPAGTAPLTGLTGVGSAMKKFKHDSPAPSTTSSGMDFEEVFGRD